MHDSVGPAHCGRKLTGRLTGWSGLLLIAASTSGCCWLWPHSVGTTPAPSQGLNFEKISLHRLGCISGDCPVYSVVIAGNGNVHYHGYARVAVHGKREAHADPEALLRLRSLLLDADVFWLRSRYTPGHDDCGAWSMNDDAVILNIQAKGLHKHIDHYLGCHNAPRLLTRIENAIDRAANVQRWTIAHY